MKNLEKKENNNHKTQISDEHENWNPQQWENYLSNLYPEKEDRNVNYVGDLIEELGSVKEDSYDTAEKIKEKYPVVKQTMSKLIQKLHVKEKQVIELIFWESKRPSEIAKELGIARATVSITKKRAIARLKLLILK